MIIGREEESELLKSIWHDDKPALIALYGRRVGKTHLIRELFGKKKHYIEITGTKDGSLGNQLQNFIDGFADCFASNWIHPFVERNENPAEKNYWQLQIDTPAWNTWAGITFEQICFKHASQIKSALGLSGITAQTGNWQMRTKKGDKKIGAQIDLIFDREDGVITLCEIKYSQNPYSLDKNSALAIANKIKVFTENYSSAKQITTILITTVGYKKTVWSEQLITQVILLDALFK